jgi:hypothetical protein
MLKRDNVNQTPIATLTIPEYITKSTSLNHTYHTPSNPNQNPSKYFN